MTSFIISILVALLPSACALGVYREYRRNQVSKWMTIPFIAIFIFLAIICVIAGWSS